MKSLWLSFRSKPSLDSTFNWLRVPSHWAWWARQPMTWTNSPKMRSAPWKDSVNNECCFAPRYLQRFMSANVLLLCTRLPQHLLSAANLICHSLTSNSNHEQRTRDYGFLFTLYTGVIVPCTRSIVRLTLVSATTMMQVAHCSAGTCTRNKYCTHQ